MKVTHTWTRTMLYKTPAGFDLQELNPRYLGERPALDRIAIEKTQSVEADLIKKIVDVLEEISPDRRRRQRDACRPFLHNLIEVIEAAISGLFKIIYDLLR